MFRKTALAQIRRSSRFLVLLMFITGFHSISNSVVANTPSPDIVIHLLDYLAKDYGGAVQNGKVVSAPEYQEQLEFGQIVQEESGKIESLSSSEDFSSDVTQLINMIENKEEAESVSGLARKLQQQAIELSATRVSPGTWPDLQLGASLYKNNCTACHGVEGRGDGFAAEPLDPKPANFHDRELVLDSSPYKFYNTIRLGVPGTGMPAFEGLSDDEVWGLAFFIKSLAYSSEVHTAKVAPSFTLNKIASLSDADLLNKLGGVTDPNKRILTAIRMGRVEKRQQPLMIATRLVGDSFEKAREGQFELATTISLRAYLEGIEPVEPKLRANIPGFVEQTERLMSQYRNALRSKESIQSIAAIKDRILAKISIAQNTLSSSRMSPKVAFVAAFSIFLREGLEAVLIILVLLTVLKAMGQSKAAKWVHLGWVLAVLFGIIAWFTSGYLISLSSLNRELLEGVIACVAVGVLIYVGFWLHRYSKATQWRRFLEQKMKQGMTSGSYVSLAVVSFMAVFREATEVVLFLRALWIELEPPGQTIAGMGVVSSIALLFMLSSIAMKYSQKIALGLLLKFCSWTMVGLAVILAGKGVHSLQEAGVVPVSFLPLNFRLDVLGIYPSTQTLLVQLGVMVLFGLLFFLDRRSATSLKHP